MKDCGYKTYLGNPIHVTWPWFFWFFPGWDFNCSWIFWNFRFLLHDKTYPFFKGSDELLLRSFRWPWPSMRSLRTKPWLGRVRGLESQLLVVSGPRVVVFFLKGAATNGKHGDSPQNTLSSGWIARVLSFLGLPVERGLSDIKKNRSYSDRCGKKILLRIHSIFGYFQLLQSPLELTSLELVKCP